MEAKLLRFGCVTILLLHLTFAVASSSESSSAHDDAVANQIATETQTAKQHRIDMSKRRTKQANQTNLPEKQAIQPPDSIQRNVVQKSSPTCGLSVSSDRKIVGGNQVAHGEVPWQAMIVNSGHFVCGGTLITEQVVLTAAHCVPIGTIVAELDVIVGKHRRVAFDRSQQLFKVAAVHRHPNELVDLALLSLFESVRLDSFANLACLPFHGINFTAPCIVTGWGRTFEGSHKSQLILTLFFHSVLKLASPKFQLYLLECFRYFFRKLKFQEEILY